MSPRASWLILAHEGAGLSAAGLSRSLVVYGSLATFALVVVGLRANWTRARFGGPTEPGAGRDRGGDWPVVLVAARVVVLALTGLVVLVGLAGNPTSGANPVPNTVFSVFWYGGLLVAALFGDWWSATNPAVALVEPLDQRRPGPGAEPSASTPAPGPAASVADHPGGRTSTATMARPEVASVVADRDAGDRTWWLPAVLLFGFAVCWLCWPGGLRPRPAAALVVVWLVTMVAGGVVHGSGWVRRHDPFGLLFSAVGRSAPVRWADGRPRATNPVRPLARGGDVGRATAAVLAVAMGASLFDGVRVTGAWADLVGDRSLTGLTVVNALALAWIVAAVAVAWVAAARSAARSAAGSTGVDVASWALGLAPALAVVVATDRLAHGLGPFLVAVQNAVSLASDPFAKGADLFGTAGRVGEDLLAPAVLAWVALVLLLAGHLVAMVAIHDRCVARAGPVAGPRAALPFSAFLAVSLMVALTVLTP